MAKAAALTGEDTPFPIFGVLRSHDVICNVAWELHGRLIVFKWKQMTWGLRALCAHMWQVEEESSVVRRDVRQGDGGDLGQLGIGETVPVGAARPLAGLVKTCQSTGITAELQDRRQSPPVQDTLREALEIPQLSWMT